MSSLFPYQLFDMESDMEYLDFILYPNKYQETCQQCLITKVEKKIKLMVQSLVV